MAFKPFYPSEYEDEDTYSTGMDFMPSAGSESPDKDRLIKDYLMRSAEQRALDAKRLANAEQQSADAALTNSITDAASRAAYAIAGVPQYTPPSTKAVDTEAPLRRVERQQALGNVQERTIKDYILGKYRADQADEYKKQQDERFNKQLGLQQATLDATIANRDTQQRQHAEQMSQKDKQFEKELELKRREESRKEKETQSKVDKVDDKLTEAQKAADKEFGQAYIKWNAGDRATAVKNITQLESALTELEGLKGKENISGRAFGVVPVPEFARSTTALRIKDKVLGPAILSLKAIMGGQFTENDRKEFEKKAWNNDLPVEDNIEKVKLAINDIKNRFAAHDAMASEYENKGTLREFKSPKGFEGGTKAAPKSSGRKTLPPGTIVNKNGQKYRVLSDGYSVEPL